VLKVLSAALAIAAVAFGLMSFLLNRGYAAAFALTLMLWLVLYMMSVNAKPR
jgi:hypothetical protein